MVNNTIANHMKHYKKTLSLSASYGQSKYEVQIN